MASVDSEICSWHFYRSDGGRLTPDFSSSWRLTEILQYKITDEIRTEKQQNINVG